MRRTLCTLAFGIGLASPMGDGPQAAMQDASVNPSALVLRPGLDPTITLTSAADGVRFDIDADGEPDQVAWTLEKSDVSFLAIDRDGDGRITSGRELFGTATYPDVRHGFGALTRMTRESNGGVEKGAVDSNDPLYGKLLLWNDANHNGVSEPRELSPASALAAAIGLGWGFLEPQHGHADTFRFRGWYHVRTGPGLNRPTGPEEDRNRSRDIWEVLLRVAR